MKLSTWNSNYNRDTAKENPTCLFLFGDTDTKRGSRGQAIIRYYGGTKNVHGIPVRWSSSNAKSS